MASQDPKATTAKKPRDPMTPTPDELPAAAPKADSHSQKKSGTAQTKQSAAPGDRPSATMPASMAKPGSTNATVAKTREVGRPPANRVEDAALQKRPDRPSRGDPMSPSNSAHSLSGPRPSVSSEYRQGRSASSDQSRIPESSVSSSHSDSRGQATTRQGAPTGERSGGLGGPSYSPRQTNTTPGSEQRGAAPDRSTSSGGRPPASGQARSPERSMRANRPGGGVGRPGGGRGTSWWGRPVVLWKGASRGGSHGVGRMARTDLSELSAKRPACTGNGGCHGPHHGPRLRRYDPKEPHRGQ
jgi:hypothetical protein